jgi:predicted DNA-binding protein YlxM (UPF0122 family)
LSLSQWTNEIKKGIKRTQELLENRNKTLFEYSILDMPKNKKDEFLDMASDAIKKINQYKEAYITPQRLEEYTQGTWINCEYDLRFTGVCYNSLSSGALFFPVRPKNKNIQSINKYINAGIRAIVLDNDTKELIKDIDIPVLLVENLDKAFEDTAKGIRENADPVTVLITGTEGKTGTKLQLHDLLKRGEKFLFEYESKLHLLERQFFVDNIKVVRIGSRVPVTLPMRITDELCDMLGKFPSI